MIIREATAADAGAMAGLLNRIIAIGGTTAHETPMAAEMIRLGYIEGRDCLSCVVAEAAGRVVGWQAVGWDCDEAHIGTFVDPDLQANGTGGALFALTRTLCLAKGVTDIFASIRADNVPGLAYYTRLGFADIGADPGFALRSGQVVGRIHRKLSLR